MRWRRESQVGFGESLGLASEWTARRSVPTSDANNADVFNAIEWLSLGLRGDVGVVLSVG